MLAKAHWEDWGSDPSVKYQPGDDISDDHPRRDWLLRSGIAVESDGGDDATEVADDAQLESITEAEAVEPELDEVSVSGKPKPTDSIEKHREYATKVGIDHKGLSRAQLIKAIRDK